MKKHLALGILCLASAACAQSLRLTVFDRLKEKASDSSEVTLNKDLLKMASSFLGSGDGAKVKKLAGGLNSILIRSLEFDKEGVYTNADLVSLVAELGGPGWNLVLSADEHKKKGRETSRIWMKSTENGQPGGLRIMSAEPKELSVIEIIGKVNVDDLRDLGGLGVPDINLGGDKSKKTDKE